MQRQTAGMERDRKYKWNIDSPCEVLPEMDWKSCQK